MIHKLALAVVYLYLLRTSLFMVYLYRRFVVQLKDKSIHKYFQLYVARYFQFEESLQLYISCRESLVTLILPSHICTSYITLNRAMT